MRRIFGTERMEPNARLPYTFESLLSFSPLFAMRQIFTSLPYVLPADPPEIAALYRAQGTERSVKKGETLKRGGEDAKLFFITEGLAAYFVAEELTGRPKVLALLPPGRAAGDLTAAIENRCNVHTRMLTDGKVLVLPASILTEAMRSEGGFAEVLVRSVIAKEECHIEGMVANFTLPPEQRLKVFFQSALTHEGGCVAGEEWWRFPYRLSAELVGEVVNLNRVSVAKILSAWFHEGLAKREGADLFVHPTLFDDVYDWLARNDRAAKPVWPQPPRSED